MRGKLIHKPQEQKGIYNFADASLYVSRGFYETFRDEQYELVLTAVRMITEKYGAEADYLQVFVYEENGMQTKFWGIHDGDGHVTFLLPEDY